VPSFVLSAKERLASLPNVRKQQLRALGRRALSVVPHRHNLTVLAVKHGGDKLFHGYIPHYQRVFAPFGSEG
jgi:hypothetical protein